MKRCFLILSSVMCAIGLAGCQCCGGTERYADAVDCINDHAPEWDWLYHPCLDLTRIGQPDWCGCGFNRLWCRRGCCAAHCGEPCPECPCPFCLEEKPIAVTAPPESPPPSAAKPTPELPPAPSPPAEPPPTPGTKVPATQDDELPTL
jgi:hypothetical protein